MSGSTAWLQVAFSRPGQGEYVLFGIWGVSTRDRGRLANWVRCVDVTSSLSLDQRERVPERVDTSRDIFLPVSEGAALDIIYANKMRDCFRPSDLLIELAFNAYIDPESNIYEFYPLLLEELARP